MLVLGGYGSRSGACYAMMSTILLLPPSTDPELMALKPGQAVLRVTPRLAFWSPAAPVTVWIHASIPKPVPDFYCPSVDLRIYDERSWNHDDSMHQSFQADCPPWTEGGFRREKDTDGTEIVVDIPATASVPWTWEINSARQHWGLGPGQWIVEVKLEQGRRRQVLRGFVTVQGGE